jgi:hypothetical protein
MNAYRKEEEQDQRPITSGPFLATTICREKLTAKAVYSSNAWDVDTREGSVKLACKMELNDMSGMICLVHLRCRGIGEALPHWWYYRCCTLRKY